MYTEGLKFKGNDESCVQGDSIVRNYLASIYNKEKIRNNKKSCFIDLNSLTKNIKEEFKPEVIKEFTLRLEASIIDNPKSIEELNTLIKKSNV